MVLVSSSWPSCVSYSLFLFVIFFTQGCYVTAASSTTHLGASSFFWFFLPQAHFMSAWSNVLGYTSLPGNEFTLSEAARSPEELAVKALANYRGGQGYDENNTYGTSLFPQGSMILTETHYDPEQNRNAYSYPMYDDPYNYASYDDYTNTKEPKSTCPSYSVESNMCSDRNECPNPKQGFPKSGGSPSVNDSIGYLAALVVIYSTLAAYIGAVIPMGNGARMRFYFFLTPSFWCGGRRGGGGGDESEDGVVAKDVHKSYGKTEALKPFNLTMKPSQVTALLGHNGAGESN